MTAVGFNCGKSFGVCIKPAQYVRNFGQHRIIMPAHILYENAQAYFSLKESPGRAGKDFPVSKTDYGTGRALLIDFGERSFRNERI